MNYYRGIPQIPQKISKKEDAKKNAPISPIAIEILEITGDELLGYYRIPEDREEALKYISQRVLLQTPSYGNGKNRKNGYDVDLDEAIFEKGRQEILSAINDDAKKPSVMTTLIPQRPWGASRLGRATKFRVELRVAIISENGERLGWSEAYYTKARYGKPELIPLLDDLVRTVVPSLQFNEK